MSSSAPEARRPRLFFALWPDAQVRAQAAELARRSASGRDRLVPAENLHITLVFLGGVAPERRACLEQAAAQVAGEPFELSLDTLGHFRRSQVAWLAPSRIPPTLSRLALDLQGRLAACGFEPEDRPFAPHLTLARKVRMPWRPVAFTPIAWPLSGFALIESFTLPTGARYQPLRSWTLKSAGAQGEEGS